MEHRLRVDILPQPDDTACGPTCLHAVYRYFEDHVPLTEVMADCRTLREGGTLAVFLACHALARGYRATIYTYNLQVFDPSWFTIPGVDIRERLQKQLPYKDTPRFRAATEGYLEFLERGGKLRLEDLTTSLIRRYLKRGIPILSGLSATFLYRSAREYGLDSDYDDLHGIPTGHFVILSGYHQDSRTVAVVDPWHRNPVAPNQYYDIGIDRVIGAILLGVLTHDANLLVIEPGKSSAPRSHVDTDRSKQP